VRSNLIQPLASWATYGDVARFDQKHVHDRCRFGAEELNVLERPSQPGYR